MITKENVLEKVKDVLAESLDIDTDHISLDDLMFSNYDIESTEILEITFRIEEEFEIEMKEDEFWNIPSLIANESTYSNLHSKKTMELIKKYFEISEESISKLNSPFELYDYISVKDLVNYIQDKIC